jgi:hypothetical protein
MPQFSIITTCKGRLHHLRESLPRFLAQNDTEVIVVDYDCPDGTAAVVTREYPAARVVKVEDAPLFRLAHARNVGAAVANGTWFAFIDADVIVVPDFSARIGAVASEGHYYRFPTLDPEKHGLYGTCVVRREDYSAIQGYDAAIQGYAGEDGDFYSRLRLIKVTRVDLDDGLIERVLQHDNAARTTHHRVRSMADCMRVNSAYRMVKNTLLRQFEVTELPESMRVQLYHLVETRVTEALAASQETVRLAIPLPGDREFEPLVEWTCQRHVYFELKIKRMVFEPEYRED